MTKLKFSKLLAFLFFSQLIFSQSDNIELKKMYKEDQSARSTSKIDWKVVSKQDSLREIRIYELINSGQVITGKDYYHTAMIFQHGKDSVAYGMAVKQMKKAIELDSTINKWLLAAAIDRNLLSRNKPQIYGTQYHKKNIQNAKWERSSIDTTQVTDLERKEYNVETLAGQLVKVHNMNLLPISHYYNEPNTLKKTIKLIKSEFKKESKAEYNVTESGINSFGYELMNSKKLINDAEAIFILNTKLYPKAPNTYDSLGECLILQSKKEEGVIAYKKSLELNPKNENAKKIIEETK